MHAQTHASTEKRMDPLYASPLIDLLTMIKEIDIFVCRRDVCRIWRTCWKIDAEKIFSPPECMKYHCRECDGVAMMILRDDRSTKQGWDFEE